MPDSVAHSAERGQARGGRSRLSRQTGGQLPDFWQERAGTCQKPSKTVDLRTGSRFAKIWGAGRPQTCLRPGAPD